jgi:hypothetical protein
MKNIPRPVQQPTAKQKQLKHVRSFAAAKGKVVATPETFSPEVDERIAKLLYDHFVL